jgi:hypothetical protein
MKMGTDWPLMAIMRSLTVGGCYLSEMALYDKVHRRAQQSQPVLGQPSRLLPTAATYILMQEFRP